MNRTIQTIGSSIKQEFDISMYNHIEYYGDEEIDDGTEKSVLQILDSLKVCKIANVSMKKAEVK